jgi:two-component system sensor histidine kinase YesM
MERSGLARWIKSVLEPLGYKNISLQGKITVNYIALLLFPIAIYYFIFNIYTDNIRKEELSLINQLNLQAVNSIDVYIGDLEQLSKQPLYASGSVNEISIFSILDSASAGNGGLAGDRKDGPQEKMEEGALESTYANMTYEAYDYLLTLLNKLVRSKEYLYSAFLFDSRGTMISYAMPNGQLFEPYDAGAQEWFSESMRLSGKPVVSSSIKFNNSYLIRPDKFYAFSVSRAIVEPTTVKKLGVVSLFADISMFRDIFTKIQSVEGENILIVDGKGSIIYDSNEDNIAKPVGVLAPELTAAISGNTDNQSRNIIMNGENYMVMSVSIDTPQWKFIRIMPENALFSNTKKVQERIIILITAFTLLSLLSSIAISFGITKPLKKLISAMKVVEKGDLSIRFRVKYNDEIGHLGRSFNNMLVEINKLIHDVYITNARKKEAELNALQTQINPHFIYNTLESIRMMAIMNDDTDTSEMVSILGKLLRYSINTKNQLVKVKDELEHLKNYLMLQNCRFEDKFELNLEIPEELYDISIIKLIFQPIVENAIYHALETLDGKGVIAIGGGYGEKGIFFEIRDNGVGMTEEELEKLIQRANDFTPISGNARGVGLRNVNERIKLYYGEEYGMRIFSRVGVGTTVRLELPDRESMNRVKIH